MHTNFDWDSYYSWVKTEQSYPSDSRVFWGTDFTNIENRLKKGEDWLDIVNLERCPNRSGGNVTREEIKYQLYMGNKKRYAVLIATDVFPFRENEKSPKDCLRLSKVKNNPYDEWSDLLEVHTKSQFSNHPSLTVDINPEKKALVRHSIISIYNELTFEEQLTLVFLVLQSGFSEYLNISTLPESFQWDISLFQNLERKKKAENTSNNGKHLCKRDLLKIIGASAIIPSFARIKRAFIRHGWEIPEKVGIYAV